MPDPKSPPKYGWLALLALTVIVILVAYLTEHRFLLFAQLQRPAAFLFIAVLLILFALLAGWAVTGLAWGVLIDDRNKMSLSRFQTALWTVVVVSAILVAAFSNVEILGRGKVTETLKDPKDPKTAHWTFVAGKQEPVELHGPGPLDLEIPPELWLVLGISVTSLVGSPMIRETKKDQTPKPEELKATVEALKAKGQEDATNEGLVIVNKDPKDARWTDLFQAEETGNGAHLDLGKVQNFYFTVILVFAYAAALAAMFANPGPISSLPAVSQGMVALLGISHAAYLANKARAQSQTT